MLPRRKKRFERRLERVAQLLATASPFEQAALQAQLDADMLRVAERNAGIERARVKAEEKARRKAEKRAQTAAAAVERRRHERPPPRRITSVNTVRMGELSGDVDDYVVQLFFSDASEPVVLCRPVGSYTSASGSGAGSGSETGAEAARTFTCADGSQLVMKKKSAKADMWVYSLGTADTVVEWGHDGVQDFLSRGDVAAALLDALDAGVDATVDAAVDATEDADEVDGLGLNEPSASADVEHTATRSDVVSMDPC